MTAHNIEGMMEFEKASNGWKCTIDVYPFRVYYIKLEGAHNTNWMLDHIEMLREDMQDRISAAFTDMHTFGKGAGG